MGEHYVERCEHGTVLGTCRCASPNKATRVVPCPGPPRCPGPMPVQPPLTVEKVERIKLDPGDVLVAHIPDEMRVEDASALAEHLRAHFPENKVIVMAGVNLEVVSSPDSGNDPSSGRRASDADPPPAPVVVDPSMIIEYPPGLTPRGR